MANNFGSSTLTFSNGYQPAVTQTEWEVVDTPPARYSSIATNNENLSSLSLIPITINHPTGASLSRNGVAITASVNSGYPNNRVHVLDTSSPPTQFYSKILLDGTSIPTIENYSNYTGTCIFTTGSTVLYYTNFSQLANGNPVNFIKLTGLPLSVKYTTFDVGTNRYLLFGNTTSVYSSDLNTHTVKTSLAAAPLWIGCDYGNATVAIISNSSTYYYTTDGATTWNTGTLPVSTGTTCRCFETDSLIAKFAYQTGASSNTIITSTDGIFWTTRTLPSTKTVIDMVQGGGGGVVLLCSDNTFFTTTDLLTFTPYSIDTSIERASAIIRDANSGYIAFVDKYSNKAASYLVSNYTSSTIIYSTPSYTTGAESVVELNPTTALIGGCSPEAFTSSAIVVSIPSMQQTISTISSSNMAAGLLVVTNRYGKNIYSLRGPNALTVVNNKLLPYTLPNGSSNAGIVGNYASDSYYNGHHIYVSGGSTTATLEVYAEDVGLVSTTSYNTLPSVANWNSPCVGIIDGKSVFFTADINSVTTTKGAISTSNGATWASVTLPSHIYLASVFFNGKFVLTNSDILNTLTVSNSNYSIWADIVIPFSVNTALYGTRIAVGNDVLMLADTSNVYWTIDLVNWYSKSVVFSDGASLGSIYFACNRFWLMPIRGTEILYTVINNPSNVTIIDSGNPVRVSTPVNKTVVPEAVAPGSSSAIVTVTGQTGIKSTSTVDVWIQGSDFTADHNQEEHKFTPIDLIATNIVPDVGFDIIAHTELRLRGDYKVRWAWSD